jgi:hypothetical protein
VETYSRHNRASPILIVNATIERTDAGGPL